MPLNPAPTLQGNMLLVTQKLLRSDMTRAAEIGYCLSTTDSTLATYQDAIDDFQANFNAQIMQIMDSEVTALAPTGLGGDGSNVPLLVSAAGSTAAGGSSGSYLPPNVAMLVRKRTASGGRQNRGRTYLPFALAEANVGETGVIGATPLGVYQGIMTAFLAQLVTDSTPMAIENKHFNVPPPVGHVTSITKSAAPVTAYTVESVIATQRRRLDR